MAEDKIEDLNAISELQRCLINANETNSQFQDGNPHSNVTLEFSSQIASVLANDPSLHLRKQKPRTVFCQRQLEILESSFEDNNYPGAVCRRKIAQLTNIPSDRVRVWFQNRRAKEKRIAEDKLALNLKQRPKRGVSYELSMPVESTSRDFDPALLSNLSLTEMTEEMDDEKEAAVVQALLVEAKEKAKRGCSSKKRLVQLENGTVVAINSDSANKLFHRGHEAVVNVVEGDQMIL